MTGFATIFNSYEYLGSLVPKPWEIERVQFFFFYGMTFLIYVSFKNFFYGFLLPLNVCQFVINLFLFGFVYTVFIVLSFAGFTPKWAPGVFPILTTRGIRFIVDSVGLKDSFFLLVAPHDVPLNASKSVFFYIVSTVFVCFIFDISRIFSCI